MNNIFLNVILCFSFHSVKSQLELESVGDSDYNESNEKLIDRAPEDFEDGNNYAKHKLSHQKPENFEDGNNDTKEKLNLSDSVATDDEVLEKEKLNKDAGAANDDQNGDDEKIHHSHNNKPANTEERNDKDSEKDDVTFPYEEKDPQHNKADDYDSPMKQEADSGDEADLFGTNQHYNIPVNYNDFGRRFVLQYLYVEKNILNDAAEAQLDNTVKNYLEAKKTSNELTPVKASPEFVLEIAKQSALLEASKPKNPTDEVIEKNILRTGEYWDDVWKEEVDLKTVVRSGNTRTQLDSIKVNISPGSRLHALISMLKQTSPRFIYVINKNRD